MTRKNKKIYEKSAMTIFKISNYLPRSYRMFTIELSSWNSSNICRWIRIWYISINYFRQIRFEVLRFSKKVKKYYFSSTKQTLPLLRQNLRHNEITSRLLEVWTTNKTRKFSSLDPKEKRRKDTEVERDGWREEGCKVKIYFRCVQVVCTSRSLTFARFLLQRRSALAKSEGSATSGERARGRLNYLYRPLWRAASFQASIYSIIIDYALLTGTRFDVFKPDNFVKLEPPRSFSSPPPLVLFKESIFKESRDLRFEDLKLWRRFLFQMDVQMYGN